MTPSELSDRIAAVLLEVASWTADPRGWGRTDLDGAVEVWDRLDRLIGDLTVMRRDHAVTLARRIDNEQRAYTRDGAVVVHRDVPRAERWDGHGLLGELGAQMVDPDTGEMHDAVPVDVLRRVIPACVQGQTSSRWKISELRKVVQQPENFREVVYGEALVARGPLSPLLRNTRPPSVHAADIDSPQEHSAQAVDNPGITCVKEELGTDPPCRNPNPAPAL